MFDSETRWFIRCDTCPDDGFPPKRSPRSLDKDVSVDVARRDGWDVRDGLHRCPRCVRENRTVMAS